ncbi:MAG: hypothetical protein ABII80_03200 [bacterium]
MMNLWQLLPWQAWVLISGVLTALAQVLGKSQVHKISTAQMGVMRDVSGILVAVPIWLMLGTGYWGWASVLAMGNGAMVAVGTLLYYKAVRASLSGSTVFGYLISQVMIVASSAVVFSEWVYFNPLTRQGLGNLLALLFTILAMLVYVKSLRLGRKWTFILIASAMINVAGNLIAKYFVSGQMRVWDYFFAEQMGFAIAGVIILLMRGQGLMVGWKNARVGLLQGMVAILGPIIYLNMLALHPLSLASMVRRMATIVVTSASGLWFYKEREKMGWRASVSLGMAVLAFILVMWVNR